MWSGLGHRPRQKTVAAHREQHPRLAEDKHDNDGGQAGQCADRYHLRRPLHPVLGERRRKVRLLALERRVVHHPGEHDGDRDIQHGDDRQRTENAAGDVALRVLGLLGGGGDDVEADEREEYDRRARQ
jgi:hypothetical protein